MNRMFTLLMQQLESRQHFSIYTVSSIADSGAGSLRQAILDANSHAGTDTIKFSIGTGQKTIAPASALPNINGKTIIDGTTQPGYAGKPIIELNGVNVANADGLRIMLGSGSTVKGLVINRFTGGGGITDYSAGGTTIQNCHIGTNVAGNAALPNKFGIGLFSKDNLVGGDNASARNVISGNGPVGSANSQGINTNNAGGNNTIKGNYIGVGADGKLALGNGNIGIQVSESNDTIINNIIANNGSAGISVGPSFNKTLIKDNQFWGNKGINVDLRTTQSVQPDGETDNDALDADTGGNDLQNKPVLTKVQADAASTIFKGYLQSKPNTQYTIDIYSDNADAGKAGNAVKKWMSFTVTTNGTGRANFSKTSVQLAAAGEQFVTTATDPNDNTSEFSKAMVETIAPLQGTVFNDLNNNGTQDAGEEALAGYVVFLDKNANGVKDAKEKSRTTNANGFYQFNDLINGTYHPRVALPDGSRQTNDPSDVTLPSAQTPYLVNFGVTNRSIIKGAVFGDKNNNGVRDAGEKGLPGWRVFLDTDNDGVWDSTEKSRMTNAKGEYRFVALKKGVYKVRVEEQAGNTTTVPVGGVFTVKLKPGVIVRREFGEFAPADEIG